MTHPPAVAAALESLVSAVEVLPVREELALRRAILAALQTDAHPVLRPVLIGIEHLCAALGAGPSTEEEPS